MPFGPKARDKPAQGKRGTSAALGCWLVSDKALKGRHHFADGRHNFPAPFQGFVPLVSVSQGAAPLPLSEQPVEKPPHARPS